MKSPQDTPEKKCNIAHYFAEGSSLCECGKLARAVAPTDPTPIGEWEVEFDEKFYPWVIAAWRPDLKKWIARLLLSQKEQHEKQLQAVREEGRKEEFNNWAYQSANDHDNKIRLQERSRIVKLIEGEKLICHEGNWQRGCVKCVEAQNHNAALTTILNALKKDI